VQCCGRPDLVDYRQARRRSARQNLDMAFNIFEREFGVTRLLDPEGRMFVMWLMVVLTYSIHLIVDCLPLWEWCWRVNCFLLSRNCSQLSAYVVSWLRESCLYSRTPWHLHSMMVTANDSCRCSGFLRSGSFISRQKSWNLSFNFHALKSQKLYVDPEKLWNSY